MLNVELKRAPDPQRQLSRIIPPARNKAKDQKLGSSSLQPVNPVIPQFINGKWEVFILEQGKLRSPQDNKPKPVKEIRKQSPKEEPTPNNNPWNKAQASTSLKDVLLHHDFESKAVFPVAGLLNNNNMCYLNAVLQALLHCKPLMAVIRAIRSGSPVRIDSVTPILDAFVAFSGEYEVRAAVHKVSSAETLYTTVAKHPRFRHLVRGRQEDAQEFLGYLLDTLEQTFDAALDQEDAITEPEPTDEWTQVGKNNKHIVARQSGKESQSQNPIVKLFGGKIQSVLRRQGAKNPSITVDPFQEVLLDISPESVNSVQDALDHMSTPEHLTIDHNGKPVSAVKQLEFIRTPPILIMFLKRFTFIQRPNGEYDFGKLTKPVAVEPVTIYCGGQSVRYRPFAVVYHHGDSATEGHYTAEVLVGDSWYNIDDDYVSVYRNLSSGRAAYMAFYERE